MQLTMKGSLHFFFMYERGKTLVEHQLGKWTKHVGGLQYNAQT